MEKRKHFGNRSKPKLERIIVSDSEGNKFKRNNLLTNAACGFGKVQQRGKNLIYTVGNDKEGYVEYFIINASLPQ